MTYTSFHSMLHHQNGDKPKRGEKATHFKVHINFHCTSPTLTIMSPTIPHSHRVRILILLSISFDHYKNLHARRNFSIYQSFPKQRNQPRKREKESQICTLVHTFIQSHLYIQFTIEIHLQTAKSLQSRSKQIFNSRQSSQQQENLFDRSQKRNRSAKPSTTKKNHTEPYINFILLLHMLINFHATPQNFRLIPLSLSINSFKTVKNKQIPQQSHIHKSYQLKIGKYIVISVLILTNTYNQNTIHAQI